MKTLLEWEQSTQELYTREVQKFADRTNHGVIPIDRESRAAFVEAFMTFWMPPGVLGDNSLEDREELKRRFVHYVIAACDEIARSCGGYWKN
jgi:hypothetical protein